MQLYFEEHFEMLVLTPVIAITRGECSNPECAAVHWQFSFSWIFWTLDLFF